jgi:hypothetical protein
MDTGSLWFGINGQIANVKDFGAVGDDSADDSAEIQAALDASATVFFPPGNYNIGTTTLRIGPYHRLIGASQYASVIKYYGTVTPSSTTSGFATTAVMRLSKFETCKYGATLRRTRAQASTS